jgi:hypothetical protein
MRWAVVLMVCGCAWGARAEEPKPYDWLLLGAAEALIAVDTMQSLDIKNHINRNYRSACGEADPLVTAIASCNPSDNAYRAFGVVSGLALAVVWYALPQRWRWLAPTVVIAVEVPNTIHNASMGMRMRF